MKIEVFLAATTWLKKRIKDLGYKRSHRYAVELLRNSRFQVKSNRVAVAPFIA